jgi:hypothetical protein
LFAWADLVLVPAVSALVLWYAVILPEVPLLAQSGSVEVGETGQYEVFYPHRYVSAPHLIVRSKGYADFEIVEQRADGFRVRVRGTSSGSALEWQTGGQPMAP